MAQNVKETLIRLNGEVGKGASQIGDTLTNIGNLLDIIGKKTRQFEIDSTNIYRDYEDQMLAAKFALSAQVESATELEKMMDGLDEAARKWASTSIFHTDDVSRAINEAAHAGWTYQEILEGIPEAMLIAQAGGMDLSNGLDYLIKMMNATRTPMDQMGTMIDQWAMAANISATNIDELGQAFMSMGAAAQFGDEPAELFAMLAALANVGTTGTKAGTALRNTIMRLIAPTTKAEAAMSMLGADVEELEEVLANENVTKAAKKLEGLGFSAFDAEGNLKPIMDIFSELFELTDGMEEAAKDELLAAIFPTRTIATALSLLTASNGELDEMYDKIKNSKGYAQSGADIMMSGLTGSIETLLSKWEEFKRSIGETLAPYIEKAAEALGGLVDKLNSLPPEATEGIVSMLTALSTIGPLLIGVGTIAKLVGFLTPLGALGLIAGAGIAYLVGYLTKLDEVNFEKNFGDLEMDVKKVGEYVDSIKTKFDGERDAISKWEMQVKSAQDEYSGLMTSMSEKLLNTVMTGGSFSDGDFDEFVTLGSKMVEKIKEGIGSAEDRDESLLQAMFGKKTTPEEAAQYENLTELMDWYYQDLYGEAEQIGQNIRDKLTEALNNNELTADDRQAIQAQIDRLNQIQAEIAAGVSQEEYYTQLEKAGRVSWDSIEKFLSENEEKLQNEYTGIDEQYDRLQARVRAAFERAQASGATQITYTDLNGNIRTFDVSKEAMESAHADIETQRGQAKESAVGKYGTISATAVDALMRDSGFSEAWAVLKDFYGANGEYSFEDVLGGRNKDSAEKAAEQLAELWKSSGKIQNILKPFLENPEIAALYRMLDSGDVLNHANEADAFMNIAAKFAEEEGYGFWGENGFYKSENLKELRGELDAAKGELESLMKQRDSLDKAVYGLGETFFWGSHEKWQANIDEQKEQVDIDIEAAEKKVKELETEIAGIETEKELIMTVDDTEVTSWEPPEFKGVLKLYPKVTGSTTTPNIGDVLTKFAEGGRATVPSIFGEAGAEWAIPEQHSERTARLLDAARRASGFTWSDLIARFGGLNANPGNSPVVLNYNPVIHAADSRGVAGVLAQDKNRLVKMIQEALEEAKYRESVEVYA